MDQAGHRGISDWAEIYLANVNGTGGIVAHTPMGTWRNNVIMTRRRFDVIIASCAASGLTPDLSQVCVAGMQ